jgi:hypothetical protein
MKLADLKLADKVLHYFLLNPVAWFLLLLLVVATYQNYKLGGQLDTVCDAIEMPDDLPDKPSTALEKAQWICEDRLDTGDMPED